jgi:hypothetical protein
MRRESRVAGEAPRTGSALAVRELTECAVRAEFDQVMAEWGFVCPLEPDQESIQRAVRRWNGELPPFDPSQIHG